jgi:hypothetical protein
VQDFEKNSRLFLPLLAAARSLPTQLAKTRQANPGPCSDPPLGIGLASAVPRRFRGFSRRLQSNLQASRSKQMAFSFSVSCFVGVSLLGWGRNGIPECRYHNIKSGIRVEADECGLDSVSR